MIGKRFFKFSTFALSMALLSGTFVVNAVTLTVNADTDLSNLYPGGQTDFADATTGDLRYCINYILNQQAQGIVQDYEIVFASNIESIQLTNKLSMVNLLRTDTIIIGNPDPAKPVTILGGTGLGGLFIRQGAVTLQNLNFQNCNTLGGGGGNGGGGGMGAGGALFIDKANVTLHNVKFTSCSATGGLGAFATSYQGGGGGLGGDGGSNTGGGGGYGGNGGESYGGGGGAGGNGGSNLGGGGGPILGNSGGIGGFPPINATTISAYTFLGLPTITPFVVGGGGYGSQNNGFGGSGAGGNNSGGEGGLDGLTSVGGNGGNGGSPQSGTGSGGAGSSSIPIPGDAGQTGLLAGAGGLGGVNYDGNTGGSGGGGGGGYSGGGGGGGSGNVSGGGGGGGGGLGGGGGGGFNANGGQGVLGAGNGGNSSIGGGGGGGGLGGGGGGGGFGNNGIANGGNGGDGGGGGGSYIGGNGGYGAGAGFQNAGGFGGGGGGNRGGGGFGGGGGAFGKGGFGAGGGCQGLCGIGAAFSLSDEGGNGAALGGAIFLGSSNGQPTLTLTGNCSTSLNSTSNNSGSSFAGGDDFFLYSGTTLNFMPNTGEIITITQSIIDDSIQSIPASSNWEAGTGSGANLEIGGSGIVTLSGINSYTGSTTISGILNLVNGTLYAGGAGLNSQVIVNLEAIFKGTGIINAPTTVFGTLSPGNSIGIIYYNAPLSLSGILAIEISPIAGSNSQIISTSTVDVTGATIEIVPDSGIYQAGSQYILLTSIGLTGTATLNTPPQIKGVLSYPNNSIVLTLLSLNPPPPASFTGTIEQSVFAMQSEISNVLKWSAPLDLSEIVSYQITRDGVLIAVVPASIPNIYYDHCRKKNTIYTYTIVSLNAEGAPSTPLSLTL